MSKSSITVTATATATLTLPMTPHEQRIAKAFAAFQTAAAADPRPDEPDHEEVRELHCDGISKPNPKGCADFLCNPDRPPRSVTLEPVNSCFTGNAQFEWAYSRDTDGRYTVALTSHDCSVKAFGHVDHVLTKMLVRANLKWEKPFLSYSAKCPLERRIGSPACITVTVNTCEQVESLLRILPGLILGAMIVNPKD